MMLKKTGKSPSKGFTLAELMVAIGIIGILATISIPNYRMYRDKAEFASMLSALKYLMDGQDFHMAENNTYFPEGGTLNIPRETAVEIPELANNFPEGNKNRYRIRTTNNRRRNYYQIMVYCDFDSNGNGRDDRFMARTDIRRGEVRRNREVVQLR